jgi:hypothetical protein
MKAASIRIMSGCAIPTQCNRAAVSHVPSPPAEFHFNEAIGSHRRPARDRRLGGLLVPRDPRWRLTGRREWKDPKLVWFSWGRSLFRNLRMCDPTLDVAGQLSMAGLWRLFREENVPGGSTVVRESACQHTFSGGNGRSPASGVGSGWCLIPCIWSMSRSVAGWST